MPSRRSSIHILSALIVLFSPASNAAGWEQIFQDNFEQGLKGTNWIVKGERVKLATREGGGKCVQISRQDEIGETYLIRDFQGPGLFKFEALIHAENVRGGGPTWTAGQFNAAIVERGIALAGLRGERFRVACAGGRASRDAPIPDDGGRLARAVSAPGHDPGSGRLPGDVRGLRSRASGVCLILRASDSAVSIRIRRMRAITRAARDPVAGLGGPRSRIAVSLVQTAGSADRYGLPTPWFDGGSRTRAGTGADEEASASEAAAGSAPAAARRPAADPAPATSRRRRRIADGAKGGHHAAQIGHG